MKIPCPCCGYFVFAGPEDAYYEICPVCYWQNDGAAAGKISGANQMTLAEAQKNVARYGACKPGFVPFARKPRKSKLPENNQPPPPSH